MIHEQMTVHLNCPPQQVFPFLVDTRKLMQWQSDLVKIEMLTEGPVRLGSRFHEVRRMGPREAEIRSEISEFTADRCLATRTETRPEAGVRYVLEPEDGGTQLRFEFNLRTTGLMRLMEPMIARSMRKGTESDLQKLRQLVEG